MKEITRAASSAATPQASGTTGQAPGKKPRTAGLVGRPVQRKADASASAAPPHSGASAESLNNDEGFLAALGFIGDSGDASGSAANHTPGTIHRKESPEKQKAMSEAEAALQRVDPATAFKAAVSGQPSELPYKEQMEQQFSTSLDNVEAHVGTPEAKIGLALIQAEAATVGRKVAFMDSSPSVELVAHEATHLVQSSGDEEPRQLSSPAQASEQEARSTASSVASGEQANVSVQAAPGTVHRSLLGGILGGVVGAIGGAAVGGLVGGPVGAVIGGVIGAAGGAAVGAALTSSDDPRLDHGAEPEMLDAQKNDADVTYKDFSETGTLFVNGISPDDVIQTNINDCYLVSVLSSLAADNPDFVRDMIRPDGPGKYSVRLYEKQDGGSFSPIWIAVSASLPSSGGVPVYGHSEDVDDEGKQELWPSIIEKAYAKLKGNYPDIDWGNTIYAFEALFGTRGDKSTTADLDADEQWEELKEALDGEEAVVCSTGRHVITVLSYSEEGGTRQVTVRDQAEAGGDENGRETITFEQFRDRYTYFRHAEASTPE